MGTVLLDIFIGAVLFAAGIGFVWLAKRFELGLGEASKTAIILLPLLVYLIVANKLTEFEGYGLKAKFREISSERTIETARAADLAISSLAANEPDFSSEALWLPCRAYYSISSKTARNAAGQLDPRAVRNVAVSIRTAIVCGKFEGLVVVDKDKKPLGFFPKNQFLELLRIPLVVYNSIPPPHESVVKDILATELGVILNTPEERAKTDEAQHVTVSSDAKLGESYKKMTETGSNVAIIVDRFGRLDGIITQAAIESRVIRKILDDSK